MTTAVVSDTDGIVAARVAAWLRVGGSWAAIAAAHGIADVDAFKVRYGLGAPPQARAGRPVQLQLFDAA